jgi:hypothetical protein
VKDLGFWGNVRRRGTHVSTLKIGSRGEVKCFGGILAFCAELRRELEWGNWGLGFLRIGRGFYVVLLRRGDAYCVFESVVGWEFLGPRECQWGFVSLNCCP